MVHGGWGRGILAAPIAVTAVYAVVRLALPGHTRLRGARRVEVVAHAVGVTAYLVDQARRLVHELRAERRPGTERGLRACELIMSLAMGAVLLDMSTP